MTDVINHYKACKNIELMKSLVSNYESVISFITDVDETTFCINNYSCVRELLADNGNKMNLAVRENLLDSPEALELCA